MNNIVSMQQVRGDTFSISTDELLGLVKKEDFCIISGKIEITRDLALKLFAVTKIDTYSVSLQQVVANNNIETIYICKATVSRKGKSADGLGACSTKEISERGGGRIHHDALATAETRAYKRAIEAVVGLPFINELILKLFGSYDASNAHENAPKPKFPISPEDFLIKIMDAKALPHLYNIWEKYKDNLPTYSVDDKNAIIRAKNAKKEELSHDRKGN